MVATYVGAVTHLRNSRNLLSLAAVVCKRRPHTSVRRVPKIPHAGCPRPSILASDALPLSSALALRLQDPQEGVGGTLKRDKSSRDCGVTFLPQRSSSVALRALFSFARVGSQRRTLLSLVGGAHLRHEKQARSDVLSRLAASVERAGGARGSHALTCSLFW